MKIFLIRHGESTQNAFTNFENYPDFKVGLTEKGKNDAKECGKFLLDFCKKNNTNLTNSILLVSPFERTRQTAEIINKTLNIKNKKEDAILIERQFGLFDNCSYEEREKYADAFAFSNWMLENNGNFFTKYPLGESNFDVYVRSKLFLSTFEKQFGNYENVFIVSHGAFLKCLQMAFFGYSPEWFCKMPFMNNCDVKLVEIINGKSFDRDYILRHEIEEK